MSRRRGERRRARQRDTFEAPSEQRSREARERAVEFLYAAQVRRQEVTDVIDQLAAAPDQLATDLAVGVAAAQGELDERLGELLADGWTVDRLALCDRWIMLLGMFELALAREPVAVVINEAVELAHRYGATERSAALVNGVLAAVAGSSGEPRKNSEINEEVAF